MDKKQGRETLSEYKMEKDGKKNIVWSIISDLVGAIDYWLLQYEINCIEREREGTRPQLIMSWYFTDGSIIIRSRNRLTSTRCWTFQRGALLPSSSSCFSFQADLHNSLPFFPRLLIITIYTLLSSVSLLVSILTNIDALFFADVNNQTASLLCDLYLFCSGCIEHYLIVSVLCYAIFLKCNSRDFKNLSSKDPIGGNKGGMKIFHKLMCYQNDTPKFDWIITLSNTQDPENQWGQILKKNYCNNYNTVLSNSRLVGKKADSPLVHSSNTYS